MYPSTSIGIERKLALMMWCTRHHQAPLPTGIVPLLPLRIAPFLDHMLLAPTIIDAPPSRHLHVMK